MIGQILTTKSDYVHQPYGCGIHVQATSRQNDAPAAPPRHPVPAVADGPGRPPPLLAVWLLSRREPAEEGTLSMFPQSIRFTAPWSRGLQVSTALLSALIAGAAALVAISLRREPAWSALAGGAMIAPLLLGWALAPKGFIVESEDLVIDRPLRSVRLPLSEIRSVRRLDATDSRRLGLLGGALRTFGSSGMFGYFGRFRSPALGSFRLYATRGDGFVLLGTERESVVVTPGDPDRFCAEIAARRS